MTMNYDVQTHNPIRTAEDMPDFLTIDELSEYLQVSKWTIYGWRKTDGGPDAVMFGKHLRFPKAAVQAWATSTPA